MRLKDEAMNAEIRTAIREAVLEAIEKVGIQTFKRTSMFLSSQRVEVDLQKAA